MREHQACGHKPCRHRLARPHQLFSADAATADLNKPNHHCKTNSPGPDVTALLGLVTIAAHFFVEDLNITSIHTDRRGLPNRGPAPAPLALPS